MGIIREQTYKPVPLDDDFKFSDRNAQEIPLLEQTLRTPGYWGLREVRKASGALAYLMNRVQALEEAAAFLLYLKTLKEKIEHDEASPEEHREYTLHKETAWSKLRAAYARKS